MALAISFDTNILIYAYDRSDIRKNAVSRDLVDRLVLNGVPVAGQVLGEFLRVAHRKQIVPLTIAREITDEIVNMCGVVETQHRDRRNASLAAERHKLQFFDALICEVIERAGVKMLLSEDMQDGAVIDGLTILNPFNSANTPTLIAALSRAIG